MGNREAGLRRCLADSADSGSLSTAKGGGRALADDEDDEGDEDIVVAVDKEGN